MNSESAAPDRRNQRHATARWSTPVGILVGLAGLAFVVRALYRSRDDVAEAISQARVELLVLALALAAIGMTGIGLGWHVSLRVLGARLPLTSSLRGYFVGQLGKYVPGGVWAVMGRGEWARSEGVSGAIAYTSVLLSMGSAYLAALVVLGLALPVAALTQTDIDGRYLWVLLLLPVGFALLHPRILRPILRALSRVTGRTIEPAVPTWGASAGVVMLQLPSWVMIGLASYVTALALGSNGRLVNILTATLISWVLGFLALPTPGGLGVREAAFVALATSLPSGIAATVAVVARLLFIVVDVASATVMTLVMSRRRTETTVSS
jgi:glycosyltransferase 2 family protein